MVAPASMIGGDGVYSYSNNSQFQKGVHEVTKEMIKEIIMEKLSTISTRFRIADFDCSVGPNTFFAVQNVIAAVQQKSSSQNMEFQVFFNDQAANDFNTLFASLPSNREYYAAATPGSFYGRRFPRASISVAHSCFALHWLSQVPKSVSDSKSPAWNEGRIHYMQEGAPKATVDAYTEQFQKDMKAFISARAEEIVPGGIMILISPAHCNEDQGSPRPPPPHIRIMDYLGNILLEMANEGIIEKAQIDAFNMTEYAPTFGDMEKAIKKNGIFELEKFEKIHHIFEVDQPTNAQKWLMHF